MRIGYLHAVASLALAGYLYRVAASGNADSLYILAARDLPGLTRWALAVGLLFWMLNLVGGGLGNALTALIIGGAVLQQDRGPARLQNLISDISTTLNLRSAQ